MINDKVKMVAPPLPTKGNNDIIQFTRTAGGGGGGGVSEPLGERMAKLEAGFEALQKSVSGIKATIIITAIAALAIAIAIIIGFASMQESHFQSLINANQQTSEARMEEFRRDSARNYDLALRALERSMGQPQPAQTPPAQ